MVGGFELEEHAAISPMTKENLPERGRHVGERSLHADGHFAREAFAHDVDGHDFSGHNPRHVVIALEFTADEDHPADFDQTPPAR